MHKLAAAAALCALLAACSGDNRPAPGQAPGWPETSPPRASGSLPVPFQDQYLPPSAHRIHQMPPVAEGENPPYAVRGQIGDKGWTEPTKPGPAENPDK